MTETPRGCSEKRIWFWDHLPFHFQDLPSPQRKRDRIWSIKESTGRAIFERFATWATEGIIPYDIREWLNQHDPVGDGSLRHSLANSVIEMRKGNLVLVTDTKMPSPKTANDPILEGGCFELTLRSVTSENRIRSMEGSFIGVIINTRHHLFDYLDEHPRYLEMPHQTIADSITALLYANRELVMAGESDQAKRFNQSELDAAINWVLFAD